MIRATIWIALALFLAGEIGRRHVRADGRARRWPWRVFTAGALACVIHVLAAYHWAHAWSQRSAIEETARQTNAVFGVAWGGGVYVNFVFVACWIADALWWRLGRTVPVAALWLLRLFYLVIIVNAAVIFAQGAARVAGAALVASLIWAWTTRPQKVLSCAGRVVT